MKPNLIYLDQNQWIFLGRAYHNRSGGKKYSAILEKIQLVSRAQSSLFPLSSAHFIETGKRRDPNSRHRLAQVMAEISQGWALAPPDYLVPSQLRVVIADIFNKRKLPWPLALGRGVAFAFGEHETMHVELGISSNQASRLQEISASPEGLIKFLVGRDETHRSRATENFNQGANRYAKSVEHMRIVGKPFSKAERKRAYVANLTLLLQKELTAQLALEKQNFEKFLALGRDGLLDFFSRVPCLDVEIELATERDENLSKAISPHDLVDVPFLNVAIPFCDVVVADKYWVDIVKRRKLDKKYNTVLLDNLLELDQYLTT
jgi:hypothetical protein